MPKFSYTAVSKEGKHLEGTTDASSRQALHDMLVKQGVRPLVIKAEAGGKSAGGGIEGWFKSKSQKVKIKDLVIFSRQMSTMVSAGVPLPRALETMETQTTNKYFKTVIASINKDVEGGISLADAFAKFPNVFNEVYVNMIKAGEAGGLLDEILKRLAAQVEQDATMRKKIKGAMTYPMVILSITVIAFFGITIFIIPKIGKILTDLGGPDAKLPLQTIIILKMSNFMIHPIGILGWMPIVNKIPGALFFIVVMVAAGITFRRYIKTPSGKYKWHALLLRTPILKDIITKIAIARFSRTFAALMSAGVTVLDALQVTEGAIGNKVIEKELHDAAIEVKNGKQLSEPLSKSPHIPSIVPQMLAIGEETGQTDTVLVKVADFYEEEVETVIDSLSSIIEPLLIIVLGAAVGVLAASVMGPIASLSKNIGG